MFFPVLPTVDGTEVHEPVSSREEGKKKKALAIDIIVDQFRESLAVFSRVAVVPVLSLMRIRVC